MTIRILEPEISSKIAAGEVVERPASVVKELVENSLDAGATQVTVEIEGGGVDLIRVTDNGHGIPAEELPLAFERHATSKLFTAPDLEHIATLGFRGEALPSISAVGRVHLMSRTADAVAGREIGLRWGRVEREGPFGCPPGTAVTVKGLFGNLPARRKFLKSPSAESARVADLISRLAMAFPQVGFRLTVDGRETLSTPGNGSLLDTIVAVYGPQTGQEMLEVRGDTPEGYALYGFVSTPSHTRSNRSYITLLINHRWVQSRTLTFALEEAYHGLLPQGRHPLAVVGLTVPYQQVDVNIHPAKKEVRFRREEIGFSLVQRSVRSALVEVAPIPQVTLDFLRPGAPQTIPTPMVSGSGPLFAAPRAGVEEPASLQRPLTPKEGLSLLRLLGQVNQTFIVAEGPDGLYLIDQHAAHERVLFEQVCQRAERQEALSQPLLEPVMVELSPGQEEQVRENLDALSRYGFSLEPFGERSYLLRAIPVVMNATKVASALQEVLDLQAQEKRLSPGDEALAASIACHSSIRGGMSLNHQQMEELLQQLESTQNPRVCPHGRPTMVHISSRHLEREFGR